MCTLKSFETGVGTNVINLFIQIFYEKKETYRGGFMTLYPFKRITRFKPKTTNHISLCVYVTCKV